CRQQIRERHQLEHEGRQQERMEADQPRNDQHRGDVEDLVDHGPSDRPEHQLQDIGRTSHAISRQDAGTGQDRNFEHYNIVPHLQLAVESPSTSEVDSMWRLTATVAGIVAVVSLLVSAQQTPPPGGRGARDAPPGPVPRTVDGHPDLHGVWLGGGPTSDIADGMQEGEAIPYSALGKKTKESRMAKDDPEANCLPTGVPRQAPYPWRILTTPSGSHMYFLFEG